MMEELLPAIVQDNSSILPLNDTDDSNCKIMEGTKSVNDPKNDNHHHTNTNDDDNNMNHYTIINEYNENIDDHNDDSNNNIDTINHHKVNIVTWFTFYSQREQREYYYEPISGITTWVVPQQLSINNNNNDTDNTMMIHDDDNNENDENDTDPYQNATDTDTTTTTTTKARMMINRIMTVMNHICGLFMNIIQQLNIYCKEVIHTYYNIYTNNNKNDDDDPTDTNMDYHYQYDTHKKQMIDRIMNFMNHILNVFIESINHMIVYCNNMIHTYYNKLITVLNDRNNIDTTTDNHHDIDIGATKTAPIRRLIHRIMIRMNHVYDLLIESMNPMITSIKDVHSNHIVPIITKRSIAIGLFVCNILLVYIYFFMILKSSPTTTSNHNLILVPKSTSLSSSTLSIVPPTSIVVSIDNDNSIPSSSSSSSSSIVDDIINNNNVQPSLLYLENDNYNNNSDTYQVDIQEEETYMVDTNQSTDDSNDNNDDVDNVNNTYMEVSVEEAPIDDGNDDENDHVSLIDVVKTSDDSIISIDEKLSTQEAIHDVTKSTETMKLHMLNDDPINDDDQHESTRVNDTNGANPTVLEQQQQQETEKEQLMNPVVSDSNVDRIVENNDIMEQQTAIQETSIDQNTDTINKYTSLDNTQNDDTTSTISNNNNNNTNTNTTIPILDQIDIIQKEVYTIVQRVGNQAIMAGYDIELEPNLTNYNRTMIQPLIVNNSNNTKE